MSAVTLYAVRKPDRDHRRSWTYPLGPWVLYTRRGLPRLRFDRRIRPTWMFGDYTLCSLIGHGVRDEVPPSLRKSPDLKWKCRRCGAVS